MYHLPLSTLPPVILTTLPSVCVNFALYDCQLCPLWNDHFPLFPNHQKNQKQQKRKSESDWNKVNESKNYTQKLKVVQDPELRMSMVWSKFVVPIFRYAANFSLWSTKKKSQREPQYLIVLGCEDDLSITAKQRCCPLTFMQKGGGLRRVPIITNYKKST